jgi:hypothetical protein
MGPSGYVAPRCGGFLNWLPCFPRVVPLISIPLLFQAGGMETIGTTLGWPGSEACLLSLPIETPLRSGDLIGGGPLRLSSSPSCSAVPDLVVTLSCPSFPVSSGLLLVSALYEPVVGNHPSSGGGGGGIMTRRRNV